MISFFTITGVDGKSLSITIPDWMASMTEPMTIRVVKQLMESQHGIPYLSINLIDHRSTSGDPMDDSEAVVEGMNLTAILEPTAVEEKQVGTAATFKGTCSITTHAPYKGDLTVKDDEILRGYRIGQFDDITSRSSERALDSSDTKGVQVFRARTICRITWTNPTETGSTEVTVFDPVDQRSTATQMLSDISMDIDTGNFKPHRVPCPEHPDAPNNLMESGILRQHVGTAHEVAIPVASDKNEGVCVTDGTLVCGFYNVESVVTKEGKVTWTVRAYGMAVPGFAHKTHAARMADMIRFYGDPYPSTPLQYASVEDEYGGNSYNNARPTPEQLNKWQGVLHQPNVKEFLTITKVPVTKGDFKRLEFVLRMLIALAVHKLVTAVGEGSPVSVHNELFERVNALSKLVPSGAGDDECPRGLSEVVSMWKLFFETYTQAAGGADSPVSLVPIKHPRDMDSAQGASSIIIIVMKLGSSFYAARVSFTNTRNDDCLAVSFPCGSMVELVHVHPAINPVFMFGGTSNEPACKKRRCE